MSDLDDTITRGEMLVRLRAILAAFKREAGNAAQPDLLHLAVEADELAAEMLRREAN